MKDKENKPKVRLKNENLLRLSDKELSEVSGGKNKKKLTVIEDAIQKDPFLNILFFRLLGNGYIKGDFPGSDVGVTRGDYVV